MPLIIKTTKIEKKPTSTLQEKVSARKLQAPQINRGENSSSNAGSVERQLQSSDKPDNSNKAKKTSKLLSPKSDEKLDADEFKKPSDPIPQMSEDKYEVVVGDTAEFSEETGNEFQEQLAMLQQAIDGTGDLKDQMQNILIFLDDNPQYKENVSPRDVSVFVAACRKVAGITVTEKTTRKTKTKQVAQAVEDVLADLADIEF